MALRSRWKRMKSISKELPAPLRLVLEQAEDEGLWFIAETAPEAYLQRELRKLHAVVEEYFAEEGC